MPYIPYLPYIPNIPYFPNMPYQTDHTHHTYPTYHTTPPPHHRGGRGKISYGASIWDPSHGGGGEGGVAGPGAYILGTEEFIFFPSQRVGLGPGLRRFKTLFSFAGAAAASQQEHRLRGGHAEAERRAEGLVGSIPGIQGDWDPNSKMYPAW